MESDADQFDFLRALMASYLDNHACWRMYVALSSINDYLQLQNNSEGIDADGEAVMKIITTVMMSVEHEGRLTTASFILPVNEDDEDDKPILRTEISEAEIAKFIAQIGGAPDAEEDSND